MSNLLTSDEVAGLRKDLELLIGLDENDRSDTDAKTIISVYRPDTAPVFDHATLQYASTDTLLYNGPAIIAPMVFRRDRGEEAGEEQMRVRVYRCLVPFDAGDIELDDYVTVDESDDPEITNRRFDVTDVMYESELAARRLTITDVTRDKAQ
jgi:hypothetical protein